MASQGTVMPGIALNASDIGIAVQERPECPLQGVPAEMVSLAASPPVMVVSNSDDIVLQSMRWTLFQDRI
jgi:hypothetical protein